MKIVNVEKSCLVESTIRSASRSAEPVGSVKYTATVTVKSLIETEREEEREIIRRKNRMAIIVLRYGSALVSGVWRDDRSERKFAASDSRVLNSSKKGQR